MIFDADAFARLIAAEVAVRLEQSLGDDVLNAEQAAELLKLHPDTVGRLAKEGELPGVKLAGQWRFRRSALLNTISPTDTAHQGVRQSLALAGD